ncbi:MAG UNVERIFIED_CONTAM: protein-export chaperone SecB [Rickettsiaceae bacterium]|jgi:preprotein translocase subunit SecB
MSEDKEPRISVEAQYIKDFSFENPNAPSSLTGDNKPSVEMGLDLNVVRIEKQKDIFEVSLNIDAKATSKDKTLFVVELKYAGIFTLTNFSDEERKFILGVHCPALLFPFARQVIAEMTQSGGFQPLMIDPIDFGALYANKMAEEEEDEAKK